MQVDSRRGQHAHERLVVGLQRQISKHIDELAIERFELHGLGDDLLAFAYFALNGLVANTDENINQNQEQY